MQRDGAAVGVAEDAHGARDVKGVEQLGDVPRFRRAVAQVCARRFAVPREVEQHGTIARGVELLREREQRSAVQPQTVE